jgi:glutamate racemase
LIPQLRRVLPDHITIIDSGEAVAKQTLSVLKERVGLRDEGEATTQFYTNGNTNVLREILKNKHEVIYKDF